MFAGLDPDATDPANLPVEARHWIRAVIIAAGPVRGYGAHLNLYSLKQGEILDYYVPGIGLTLRNPTLRKLGKAMLLREYDKGFLNRVFVAKDEVRNWCLILNQVLPGQWFREDEIDNFEEERRKIYSRWNDEATELVVSHNELNGPDGGDNGSIGEPALADASDSGESIQTTAIFTPKSQQAEAANKRHERSAAYKRNFIRYCITVSASGESDAKKARDFCMNLPDPDTSVRSLCDAATEWRKRSDAAWLQCFDENSPPEPLPRPRGKRDRSPR